MDFMSYITEQALILIPVLYILGGILKQLEYVKDKYIPVILLLFGVSLSIPMSGLSVESIIQGILVTGAAVLTNQIKVQSKKEC